MEFSPENHVVSATSPSTNTTSPCSISRVVAAIGSVQRTVSVSVCGSLWMVTRVPLNDKKLHCTRAEVSGTVVSELFVTKLSLERRRILGTPWQSCEGFSAPGISCRMARSTTTCACMRTMVVKRREERKQRVAPLQSFIVVCGTIFS